MKRRTTRRKAIVNIGGLVWLAVLMLGAGCGSSGSAKSAGGVKKPVAVEEPEKPEDKLSPEDKAALAKYKTIYNTVSGAAKKDSVSVDEYFGALYAGQQCTEISAQHGELTVETIDGQMKVADVASRCAELTGEVRKRGTAEEGCGYAAFSVLGGKQAAGQKKWSNELSVVKKGGDKSGSRVLAPCDKVPAKSNKMPKIWRGKYAKAAEEACGKGTVVIYQSTEWEINETTAEDGTEQSERTLLGQCWYLKGPVNEEFSLPSQCSDEGTPPGGEPSCLTSDGKLIVGAE